LLAQTHANRRSILSFFTPPEEKGLFGSAYLTRIFRHGCIGLQVNMDMIGREHPDSIYCIGSNRLSTELYDLVRE